MAKDDLPSLSDVIASIKDEIKSAMVTDNKMFQLGEVTIKTKVAITSKDEGGGKVNIYVVTAEVGGESQQLQSNEVSIVLKPRGILLMGGRRK